MNILVGFGSFCYFWASWFVGTLWCCICFSFMAHCGTGLCVHLCMFDVSCMLLLAVSWNREDKLYGSSVPSTSVILLVHKILSCSAFPATPRTILEHMCLQHAQRRLTNARLCLCWQYWQNAFGTEDRKGELNVDLMINGRLRDKRPHGVLYSQILKIFTWMSWYSRGAWDIRRAD